MKLKEFMDEGMFEDWVGEDTLRKPYKKYTPSREFFASRGWRILRRKVLDFYGEKCMRCGVVHDVMQVDHIKPRAYYPELETDFSNLQVLCIGCNKSKGTQIADYRPKYMLP